MTRSSGLPPVVDSDARVLILGSLPSRKSLELSQYYGHPQNAFWRIMGELFGAGLDLPYPARVSLLKKNNVAVWDVLASSVRPGSMDSDIDTAAAEVNDFGSFLSDHASIRLVCFNGQKACRMFDDMVVPRNPELRSGLRFETLPSTSPAHASMPFNEKLERWSVVRQHRSERKHSQN